MKKSETLSEEIEQKRYRHFMFILYKDSESYSFDDVLFDLKGSFKNYAYIFHKPEKDEKKEHCHFILSLDNGRSINSIASRVGVQSNYIQPIKSLRASCRYLVHMDDDSKIQYDLTDVTVSHSFQRKFFLVGMSLKEAMKHLVIFVNSQNYDTIYKRYRPEFIDYLKEQLKLT